MALEIKLAYDDTENVTLLFEEYVDLLVDLEPVFRHYLDLQEFQYECQELQEKYGLPGGRLYIAYWKRQVAGCIALKQIDEATCEMKRLYVRPQFGGKKIGESLVKTILNDAAEIGYQSMVLDTFPSLDKAIHLYEKLGFYRIPPYSNSPVPDTVYMKFDLAGHPKFTL